MPANWRQLIVAALALMPLLSATPVAAGEDAIERGDYLVRAGGCFSCRTAPGGEQLAGGRALATPFGTFYSPNITADPETGSAAGPMRNSCGHCAMACGPTGPTISRCFPIRALPASATAMPWR